MREAEDKLKREFALRKAKGKEVKVVKSARAGAEASAGKSTALASGTLFIQRLKNANRQSPSKAVLENIQFHPLNPEVFITAGRDQ